MEEEPEYPVTGPTQPEQEINTTLGRAGAIEPAFAITMRCADCGRGLEHEESYLAFGVADIRYRHYRSQMPQEAVCIPCARIRLGVG